MSRLESIDIAEDSKNENNQRKRVRHRKKQLYENILKQMEFYFSDANLTKDRYLGELVKSDPYVRLDVFLKFNKIRSMTQDIIDIAKAMKHSTFLQLSEDKLKVKRQTPVLPYDADQRTVYVESIPVSASREWLEQVFSDYGHVAYISLPKFKNSQRIKGYGFIEFDKQEDAQKCINTFTKMGCKLPTGTPPEELSSIKMFSVEDALQDSKEEGEHYEPPRKKIKKKERKLQKNLELKLEHVSESEAGPETPTDIKYADTESKEELTSQDEGKEDDGAAEKKTRKQNAKETSKAKIKLSKNEAPKGALWGLQVLSKSEWKALRNKYLNLQRKYMKQMKTDLRNNRYSYSSIPAPAAPNVGVEQDSGKERKNIPTLERIPGVFVKEELPEPCLDVRLTKRTIRSNVHAQHVDVKEGQSEVIIRFDSAKAADEYCKNSSNIARVICGAEEDEQWARAESGRSSKRPRGRCRLLARHLGQAAGPTTLAPASPQPTHTHIRFDDE